MSFFLKGLLIALVFGVPAGAIGALTIQRSIQHGFLAGLVTGLGSTVADLIYACAGVFGFTLVFDFITSYGLFFQIAGGVLVLLFGVMILRKKAVPPTGEKVGNRLVLYFLSSFSIAILNPVTIASFLLAFTTFGLEEIRSLFDGIGLLSGIFIGTVLWWIFISTLSTLFRNRITNQVYRWLNIVLGLSLTAFGIVIVLQGVLG